MVNNMNPGPVTPTVDLRDMLRRYVIRRSLDCMAAAGERRERMRREGRVDEYRRTIGEAVRKFYGTLPAGPSAPAVRAREVSRFQRDGYRIENVLFDSFPGWEVNATVYVPTGAAYQPPFPAVVVPVGHSGKQFDSYQLPGQFFARNGYLAVLFDPPGQSGEKKPGNDHFIDGVRCYLVGETSSRYFVADALRCIDYLAARADADLTNGVAMTGVSGGGTTTTLAGLLDDRITVLGPSCCLAKLADLDISQCYAGCPETHMFGRYAAGIDEVDLLCAACPKPMLLMAGERDEVFRIDDTRRLAGEVTEFYRAGGHGEAFELFVDRAGHCYSLDQAAAFVRFMNWWLVRDAGRTVSSSRNIAMHPETECQCRPRTDVNMRTLTLDRARELAQDRDRDPTRIRRAAMKVANIHSYPAAAPKSAVGAPFQVWFHYWQQVLLCPEESIQLPATFLYPAAKPNAAILHFDDQHRNRWLYRNAPLAEGARFCDSGHPVFGVLSVDLRGWGDTVPAMYPYELASWGSTDRTIAYMSAALGDPVLAMRIRDGLSALAYLRTRPEIDASRIVVSGTGLGAVVALHVAAIDQNVQGVVVCDFPASFLSLLEAEHYFWPADAFLPNVLPHYDLPDLARSLKMPVEVLCARTGTGRALSATEVRTLYGNENAAITACEDEPSLHSAVTASLQRLLDLKA